MKTMFFSLLLAVCLASGCVSRGQGSFVGPLPEHGAVIAIANDAVSILVELYPPGHTTLHLLPAKAVGNGFAAAFESGLRTRGFTLAISAVPGRNASADAQAAPDFADTVTLAYTLDMLEVKAAWYLQLRLSDGRTIARAYTANGSPEAGQSRTVSASSPSILGNAVNTAKEKAGAAYEATRDFLKQ